MSSQENTPPRQARDRHLSLKATEIFEHKRQALVNSIDQYVKRIDQCISDLEDPDDMVLARKNVQKAHFNHERYTSSCNRLLALYMSAGTT